MWRLSGERRSRYRRSQIAYGTSGGRTWRARSGRLMTRSPHTGRHRRGPRPARPDDLTQIAQPYLLPRSVTVSPNCSTSGRPLPPGLLDLLPQKTGPVLPHLLPRGGRRVRSDPRSGAGRQGLRLRRSSTRPTTASATRSSSASTASRSTEPWPRDTDRSERKGSDGDADGGLRADAIHHLLKMGAPGEVRLITAKGTFDEFE